MEKEHSLTFNLLAQLAGALEEHGVENVGTSVQSMEKRDRFPSCSCVNGFLASFWHVLQHRACWSLFVRAVEILCLLMWLLPKGAQLRPLYPATTVTQEMEMNPLHV